MGYLRVYFGYVSQPPQLRKIITCLKAQIMLQRYLWVLGATGRVRVQIDDCFSVLV